MEEILNRYDTVKLLLRSFNTGFQDRYVGPVDITTDGAEASIFMVSVM